jgi:hypothetical protein
MLIRIKLYRAARALCALVALEGCVADDGGEGPGDPVPDDWFAYFRLTQGDEVHLYIRGEWEYALVPDAPMSADDALLASEHRMTIEDLFSNGLENYESDSMSGSGADMGECDATAAHPIVHRVLINPDPLVGAPGFGCWSPDEDLSEDTRMMIERMEGILHDLTDGGDGDDDDAGI